MNETKIEKRRENMRRQSKHAYYNNDGKTKSLFKYYKRKFINDDNCVNVINNIELDIKEKLKFLHNYNQQLKWERMT